MSGATQDSSHEASSRVVHASSRAACNSPVYIDVRTLSKRRRIVRRGKRAPRTRRDARGRAPKDALRGHLYDARPATGAAACRHQRRLRRGTQPPQTSPRHWAPVALASNASTALRRRAGVGGGAGRPRRVQSGVQSSVERLCRTSRSVVRTTPRNAPNKRRFRRYAHAARTGTHRRRPRQ